MYFHPRYRSSLNIILLSFMAFLASCGGSSSSGAGANDADPMTNEPMTSEPVMEQVVLSKLVAIGDSITVGRKANGPAWPSIVAADLGVPVIVEATSGQTTDYGLAVIENLLIQHKPSHVAILLGTNDSRVGQVQNAISNLQTMADIARSHNVIPVIGTIPVLAPRAENDNSKQVSNGIENISNATIARVRETVGNDLSILADGVHPTAEGQQRIAIAFESAF